MALGVTCCLFRVTLLVCERTSEASYLENPMRRLPSSLPSRLGLCGAPMACLKQRC
jgi:hypothetical protein